MKSVKKKIEALTEWMIQLKREGNKSPMSLKGRKESK